MNRQLILISNPGNPNDRNYAPSTELALDRWQLFFQSPIGGFWKDNEIRRFDEQHPLDSEQFQRMISMVLDSVQCDYSIIVFCGHGCSTMDGRDAIQLPIPAPNYNNLFPVDGLLGLNVANVRRTGILDSGRSIVPFTSQQLFEQRQFSEVYRIDGEECGKYYNSMIIESNPHVELLQSTNLHSASYGSVTGSRYADAVSLITNQSSINWKQRALMDRYGQYSYSMLDLHQAVHAHLDAKGNQLPENHSTVQLYTSFPFAALHLPNDRTIYNDNAMVEIIED